ncbi:hypothetical protein B0H13DRAFT_1861771 [Mycena leptocephala]|nr:hypothetical protein B0H13DRAFT_1861771 [Mycena leptocephala]
MLGWALSCSLFICSLCCNSVTRQHVQRMDVKHTDQTEAIRPVLLASDLDIMDSGSPWVKEGWAAREVLRSIEDRDHNPVRYWEWSVRNRSETRNMDVRGVSVSDAHTHAAG